MFRCFLAKIAAGALAAALFMGSAGGSVISLSESTEESTLEESAEITETGTEADPESDPGTVSESASETETETDIETAPETDPEFPALSDYDRKKAAFGEYRLGTDIIIPYGTELHSLTEGVVTYVYNWQEDRQNLLSPYGNVVEICDCSGTYILYSRLSDISVCCGDKVSEGDVIGHTGSSGTYPGEYLHLEVTLSDGTPADASAFLDGGIEVPVSLLPAVSGKNAGTLSTPSAGSDGYIVKNTRTLADSAQSSATGDPSSWVNHYREIVYGAETFTGYCGNHDKGTPADGTDMDCIQELTSNTGTDGLVRRILYYGYKGPATLIGTSDYDFLITELAISYALDSSSDCVNGLGKQFISDNNIRSLGAAPSNFRVFRLHLAGSQYTQDIFIFKLEETAVRGDLEIWKEDGSGEAMAGVTFRLDYCGSDSTCSDVVESITICTDENGYYSSASSYALHSLNTNSAKAGCGTWISGEDGDIDNDRGALPEGYYRLTELRSSANSSSERNLTLWEGTFRIRNEGQSISKKIVDLPIVSTKLLVTGTSSHFSAAAEGISLTDTVSCRGLVSGETYTVKGQLYYADNGKPSYDDTGDPITSSGSFTAGNDGKGSCTLVYEFDAETLAGKKLSAFAEVYSGSTLIGYEKDLTEDDQAVSFGSQSTVLLDSTSLTHYSACTEKVTLVDTVTYTNLQEGSSYIVTGYLYDKTSGADALDVSGNRITVTVPFKAASGGSGSVTVKYAFKADPEALAGKTYVAFETISKGSSSSSTPVVIHNAPDDTAQQIYFPGITTVLSDTASGGNIVNAAAGVTVTDSVSYVNLEPGTVYTLKGSLYDAAAGSKAVDDNGSYIEAETTFTASSSGSGTVTLSYSFDAETLGGAVLTAYAEVSLSGKTVAFEHDLDEEAQQIRFPRVETQLTDENNGTHYTSASQGIIYLLDTVVYTNLKPNTAYTLEGILYDTDTGVQAVDSDGEAITSSVSFTTGSGTYAAGSVMVDYSFRADESLAGKTYTAFETLKEADGTTAALHHSLYDEAQQITLAGLSTTAIDSGNGTHFSVSPDDDRVVYGSITSGVYNSGLIEIRDTVRYIGLVPGQTYTLLGKIVFKDDGTELKNYSYGSSSGGYSLTAVTSVKTFTASSGSGSVEMDFSFYSEAGKVNSAVPQVSADGRDLVVLEYIYVGSSTSGTVFASHENLDSASQTIHVCSLSTEAVDPGTGTHIGITSGENAYIVDTVKYTNLMPGVRYTLEAVLMDKDSGEVLMNSDSPVTASSSFVPQQASGSWAINFTLPCEILSGKSIVVFERLYQDGTFIGSHEDIDDEDQTVTYITIDTSAKESVSGGGAYQAGKAITITDMVTYEGMDPSSLYMIRTQLYDKTLGSLIEDSLTDSTLFSPSASSGSLDISITFTGYAGQDVVVYQYLYLAVKQESGGGSSTSSVMIPAESFAEGFSRGIALPEVRVPDIIQYDYYLVASHADPDDEDQTIHFFDIDTTAADSVIQGHVGYSGDSEVTISDTVTYDNLVPGEVYTIKGTLYEASGEPLAYGEETFSEQYTFTAGYHAGSETLQFTIPGEAAAGKKIVVGEVLYFGEETSDSAVIGKHFDLEDEDQTIFYPAISTSARGEESGDSYIEADVNAVIIDTCYYSAILPGTEYMLKACLMDKETGLPVTENGSEVTASLYFTPDTESGEQEIRITFDAENYLTHDIVVFEYLYDAQTGELAASHEDYASEEQTVRVIKSIELTVGKTARGVSGESEEYFEFTAEFSGLDPETRYPVDLSAAEALILSETGGETVYENSSEFTSDDSGCAEYVFWIRSGQCITFKNLPAGTSYSVSEDDELLSREYYSTAAEISGDTVTGDGTDEEADLRINTLLRRVADDFLAEDTEIMFINTFQPAVPTGINIGSGTAELCAAGAAALALMLAYRRIKESRS
ncbi:MAG: VaFE repeat-containing surface-anchored protein [Lachnospiraceae bacterium]|nr:VaFE repeat-containing surface-anchored protein [Lachnospiraceae bacterium]